MKEVITNHILVKENGNKEMNQKRSFVEPFDAQRPLLSGGRCGAARCDEMNTECSLSV